MQSDRTSIETSDQIESEAAGQFNIFQFKIEDIKIDFDASPLGRGQYGAVRRGTIEGKEKQYAVKVMTAENSKFHDEIDVMMELTKAKAPYIVKLKGYCIDKIAMPIAERGSLENNILTLIWPQQITIMHGISVAIEFLHARNILHCDIKPDNVLLTNDLMPRLADFGLARRMEKIHTYSRAAGTPVYSDPNLFCKEMNSKESDIYSCSVSFDQIMLKISLGQMLGIHYANMNPKQLMMAALDGKRLPVPDECPPKLAHLISLGWMKDKALRPNAREFVSETKALLSLTCN